MFKNRANNQQSHQHFKFFQPTTSLPTLNQFMLQPMKQIPVVITQKQKLYQNASNGQLSHFLLSPKSKTNLYKEASIKNRSPLINRLLFEEKNQLKEQQAKYSNNQFISSSPNRQIYCCQVYKPIESNKLKQKRKHERVQSEQLQQINILRIDNRRAKELNSYYKKQLQSLRSKLESYEKQLREQLIIIEEKQEIIRKMSSFNDELCLKIIQLHNQQPIQKSKQSYALLEQVDEQMVLKKNEQLALLNNFNNKLIDTNKQSWELLRRKVNQQKDTMENKQTKKLEEKCEKIDVQKHQLNSSSKLINPEQITKEDEKYSFKDISLTLKEKMSKFWQQHYEEKYQKSQKS